MKLGLPADKIDGLDPVTQRCEYATSKCTPLMTCQLAPTDAQNRSLSGTSGVTNLVGDRGNFITQAAAYGQPISPNIFRTAGEEPAILPLKRK